MNNLAKTNRPNQNLVFNALMLLCIGAFLISCGDDDESNGPSSPQAVDACSDFSAATTDRGSTFTLSFPDGTDTVIIGEFIPNLLGIGNYFGGNIWRQVRVFSHIGIIHFRVSMPSGTNTLETMTQEHALIPSSLGNTSGLEEPYPELWIPDNDTIIGNASGTVSILRDAGNESSGNFAIYGTIDAEFNTVNTSFNIRGCFWNIDYDWFG
ncbi:MAG: hypothetical protein LC664_04695 [Flavobacteriales bacterium]|nr:hypothetical protein [Flavobacteriales bacterium]